MKSKVEHKIQCDFIGLARMYLPDEYLVYSNQNESYGNTKDDMIRGKNMKAAGRLAGIPDVFIAWPRLGFHGLYIEFKKPKPNKTYLKPHQRDTIEKLRIAGYCVAVCRDAVDAFELLKRYTLGADPDAVIGEHNWR